MVAFLAVLMIIPFRGGRKRRLIVVTNIVSSNRTWTTTLSLEKSSRNMLMLNILHLHEPFALHCNSYEWTVFAISPYKGGPTCSDVANFSDLVLKMSLAVVVRTVTIRVTSSQILRSRVPEDVKTD